MAELRPFRGLRYRVAAAEAGRVIAPPFDVISPQQQEALYELSESNVIRLEYPREIGEARYASAAGTLERWRRAGVLTPDARPALYLYEQIFAHAGRTYRRRAVLGRVRLEPPDTGVIRPHEYTMSKPKEDRLALLRATRTNISPIYALVDDRNGAFTSALASMSGPVALDAQDFAGQRHRLTVVHDQDVVTRVAQSVASAPLYIADGHHRYETALAYQAEQRAAAGASWTGDEPANFILMAITATSDPGLLILPIHRLVRPKRTPADVVSELRRSFDVQDAGPLDDRDASQGLVSALAQAGGRTNAFAAAGLQPGRLHLLTLRDRDAVEELMPAGHPPAWKALDVNVLQYGVLEPLLGIDAGALAGGEQVEFSEDAEEALEAVRAGRAPLAFLVNATRPEHIIAVADAGDRMPQKSTYFYPKLGTGLVLNAHDLD